MIIRRLDEWSADLRIKWGIFGIASSVRWGWPLGRERNRLLWKHCVSHENLNKICYRIHRSDTFLVIRTRFRCKMNERVYKSEYDWTLIAKPFVCYRGIFLFICMWNILFTTNGWYFKHAILSELAHLSSISWILVCALAFTIKQLKFLTFSILYFAFFINKTTVHILFPKPDRGQLSPAQWGSRSPLGEKCGLANFGLKSREIDPLTVGLKHANGRTWYGINKWFSFESTLAIVHFYLRISNTGEWNNVLGRSAASETHLTGTHAVAPPTL